MPSVDDPLLEKMADQVAAWQHSGDQRWLFLACYRLMSNNMLQAIPAGGFHDPVWVDRLLRHFADYYFDALAQYRQAPDTAPAVWVVAHQAAATDMTPLQKMLLGVNAHINYDLVLALYDVLQPEWVRLDAAARAARYADHCTVNRIIGDTVDAVQDEILAPLMPGMVWVDQLLGRFDEQLLSGLIAGWREDVWEHAGRLLSLPDAAARRRHLDDVESHALRVARRITF